LELNTGASSHGDFSPSTGADVSAGVVAGSAVAGCANAGIGAAIATAHVSSWVHPKLLRTTERIVVSLVFFSFRPAGRFHRVVGVWLEHDDAARFARVAGLPQWPCLSFLFFALH
jgi:hypothetical protein